MSTKNGILIQMPHIKSALDYLAALLMKQE